MSRAISTVASLAMVLGLASCFRDHPSTATEVRGEECVACHLDDYDGTTQPVHVGNATYPTTCANCHVTTGWQPALDGNHPENNFPITHGPHTGIKCMSCHDLSLGGSSTGGANTNCLQCHHQPDVDPHHNGVSGYHYDSSQPHFCLSCHPDGMGGGHPGDKFPIANGAHSNIPCDMCHDSSLGSPDSKDNTNCLTCHIAADISPHHTDVGGYNYDTSKPHFCLDCHPNGRNQF